MSEDRTGIIRAPECREHERSLQTYKDHYHTTAGEAFSENHAIHREPEAAIVVVDVCKCHRLTLETPRRVIAFVGNSTKWITSLYCREIIRMGNDKDAHVATYRVECGEFTSTASRRSHTEMSHHRR